MNNLHAQPNRAAKPTRIALGQAFRKALGILAFAAWLVSVPQARAWNAEGHMVVAQIAYNHLDPQVKAQCDYLIAAALPTNVTSAGTSNFVTASVWADDFKTTLGSSIWHYIDIPFSLDGTSTNGVGFASFDVIRAIRQNISVLQNTNAVLTNRAENLRYLLHFAGDIHQPLHASDAVSAASPGGDAGGNSFSISSPSYSNLHSLWDGGGGFLADSISRPLITASQNILNNKVAGIEADYPYLPNKGVIPDPADWANEGWLLAQTVSYVGISRFSTPSAAYLSAAQATTEARMAVAGHRLADLLNTLFDLKLTGFTRTGNNISFSWLTAPGHTYRVQYNSQSSTTNWTNLTTFVASTNALSYTATISNDTRLYRVMFVN